MRKPKHVHAFRTRHGKLYVHFRRAGFQNVPLPVLPYDSPEFELAYRAAMNGETAPRAEIGANRTKTGTVNALCIAYYSSAAFQGLSAEAQRVRRNIVERFRAAHGDKRVALIGKTHVDAMVAAKASTPAAARNFLHMLRALMKVAIVSGMRSDDPTQGVKSAKIRSDGFYTWNEDDISRFEARHAIGSRARLALALLLFTAQRRSDVIRMGRQHIRDGQLAVRQKKTGTSLMIPVHPDLQLVLNATPSENLTFLTTQHGSPFSPAGFTNWFRTVCNEAGLSRGVSAHGLRKAACRRLAEAGCSAPEIMAVSGHKNLREVQRYIEADQIRMARAAMDRQQAAEKRTTSGKPA